MVTSGKVKCSLPEAPIHLPHSEILELEARLTGQPSVTWTCVLHGSWKPTARREVILEEDRQRVQNPWNGARPLERNRHQFVWAQMSSPFLISASSSFPEQVIKDYKKGTLAWLKGLFCFVFNFLEYFISISLSITYIFFSC